MVWVLKSKILAKSQQSREKSLCSWDSLTLRWIWGPLDLSRLNHGQFLKVGFYLGKIWLYLTQHILKLLKNIWFLAGNVTLTSSSPYSCVETFAFPRCGPTPEWRGKLTISHISHLINPQPQSAGPLELGARGGGAPDFGRNRSQTFSFNRSSWS